ncbi:MAG: transposase [Candidatus Helarchaeota archaeon]
MDGEELEIKVKNTIVASFHYFYTLIMELFKIDQLPKFKTSLATSLENLTIHDTKYSKSLREELIKRLPKNGLTEKNLKYYRQKVKGALALVLRQFRRQLEQAQKEFNKVKTILLKRPENLSTHEAKFLTTYLKRHSEFCKYRNLSMRISNIYHDPPEKLTPSIITDIELWAEAHPDLTKAIKTFKKNVDKIFNFLQIYSQKKFQKYPKISRVTPEPQMRKIKDLVRKKYGFRTVETTQLLLENQLNCPIFVSPL